MRGQAFARRPSETRRMLRLFGRFSRGQRRTFLLALALLGFEAGTAVFEAYPLAYLIDYLKGDRGALRLPYLPADRTGTVLALTLAILLIAAINSAADSLAKIVLAQGGRRLGFNLRTGLFSHLQRLSLAFHDRRRTGDVITRVTGDVNEVENFVVKSLSDFAGSVMLLVGSMAFLTYLAWQVALIALLIVPVLAFISHYFSSRIRRAAKEQRAYQGELASSSQEMLTSIRVVQIFGRGGHDERRFAHQSRGSMDASLRLARLEAVFSFVVSLLQAASIGAVVWIGIWLIDLNALSVGTLVFLVLLIKNMFKPTRRIIREWNTVGKLFASVERIADLLDRSPTVQDLPHAVPAPRLTGEVEFRDVSFAYELEAEDRMIGDSPATREALRHLSFQVPAGTVLALVGPSGAGKTTIAQLIPRLYDPSAGAVLLDGHDVRGFTLDSLRSQVSMVLQETLLLSGTVAENIAYGCPGATREDVVAAAIRANAHEFIQQMPEGYDTDLTERASNLSGGQRQRIAIARAFIRDTPILILDEPTTGLDAESADLVLSALRSLIQDKTTIVISHDLSLVRHADRILVLRGGEITQSGNHERLIDDEGLYADLYFKQMGGRGKAGRAARRRGELDPEELDPARNRRLLSALPSLPTALDGDEMAGRLEEALMDPGWRVESCAPAKALYHPGGECTLRYRLEVRHAHGGSLADPLVGARLLGEHAGEMEDVCRRLSQLAERVPAHRATGACPAPVALLPSLAMVTHIFPIDPALPTLIRATDPGAARGAVRPALPGGFDIDSCHVTVARYPRSARCVLRYDVAGTLAGKPARHTLYGKIGTRHHPLIGGVLSELDGTVGTNGASITVPRLLAYRQDLDLALYDEVPGTPLVAELVQGWARGTPGATAAALGEAVDRSALAAAALHGSGIEAARIRTFAGELATLRANLFSLRTVAPRLATLLGQWGDAAEREGRGTALPARLAHGDFTHSQILFDGNSVGVVDFDTVAMAEPALDLGRFCAYLRYAIRKAERSMGAATSSQLGDDLGDRLVSTYAAAVPSSFDAAALRDRVRAYEFVTLLQMAAKSWWQLKPARTANVLNVLEERTR